MKDVTDLASDARKGSPEAFSQLYQLIYRDLYHFALYILKNRQDAEDAVSEAVMDAWKAIKGLRSSEAFKAWIFKILTAKCKQRLKSYLTKPLELTDDLLSEERDLSEDLDVRKAFYELNSQERLILGLHIFAGYTSIEIGKALFLSPGTVRSCQSRALKKMAVSLENLN